jgi:hypothetical protein
MPGWYKWLAERAARFRRLPVPARRYMLTAMFHLLAARIALRVIPFRRLTRFFARPPRGPQESFAERQRVGASSPRPFPAHKDEITEVERQRFKKGVQWVANEAAWYLPGETVCFPRAMAAQALLRRLGVGATLVYGAATLPERGLTAHVWLQDGSELIFGEDEYHRYHTLARYPDDEANPVFTEEQVSD